MSKVDFRNTRESAAIHVSTGRRGALCLRDRVVSRGRGMKRAEAKTFEAIFSFDAPLICLASEVPENGGYFMGDNGMVEVTQLIGRFASSCEREAWLDRQFGRVADVRRTSD